MDPFVLVRHAEPLRDSSLTPGEWKLDPNHVGAISDLASVLENAGLVQLVTSSERRAIETGTELARLMGVPMDSDSRLDEVRRPFVDSDGALDQNVEVYLAGVTVVGWEEQATVIERMHRAVEDALALGFVGLVGHGTAMSLFLGHLGLVRPWEFWRALTTPDGWVIDGSTIQRLPNEDSV